GLRMFEQTRPVPDLHRLEGGDAWADDLAAAAVAGHEMRLDQSGGDLQISADVAAIEIDRHAVLCRAEIIVLFQDLAVMVLDSIILSDVLAEHLDQLGPLVRPVQAGGDQDEDVAAANCLLFERAQKGG